MWFFCYLFFFFLYNLLGDDMDNSFDSNVISHSVKILERNNIFISGTKKVVNFDDKEFSIITVMGGINIKGEGLELIKLDTNDGNICIKGKIDSVFYTENIERTKDSSFLGKLFK